MDRKLLIPIPNWPEYWSEKLLGVPLLTACGASKYSGSCQFQLLSFKVQKGTVNMTSGAFQRLQWQCPITQRTSHHITLSTKPPTLNSYYAASVQANSLNRTFWLFACALAAWYEFKVGCFVYRIMWCEVLWVIGQQLRAHTIGEVSRPLLETQDKN